MCLVKTVKVISPFGRKLFAPTMGTLKEVSPIATGHDMLSVSNPMCWIVLRQQSPGTSMENHWPKLRMKLGSDGIGQVIIFVVIFSALTTNVKIFEAGIWHLGKQTMKPLKPFP